MSKRIDEELIASVYGPPPINNRYMKPQPTVYGPPPTKKWRSCSVIVIIGVLIGGILAFLICRSVVNPAPTVYGPPPVDTTQTDSILDNE